MSVIRMRQNTNLDEKGRKWESFWCSRLIVESEKDVQIKEQEKKGQEDYLLLVKEKEKRCKI